MSATEEMFDADVRVETMMWIPGAVLFEDDLPEAFEDEFCDWLPESQTDPLYSQLPLLAKFSGDEDRPEAEVVADALRRTPGFLVQAATPVRHYMGDNGIFSSGWGNYYTAWLYAADEAQIPVVCVAWAKERHESDKASKAA